MKTFLMLAAALVLTLPAAAATPDIVPQADGASGCLAQDLGLIAMSSESMVETAEQAGLPEPLPMAGCSEEWYEYRWVYGGCCYSGWNVTWKDKQQRRSCCLTTQGVTCGGWYDTGATSCRTSPCPN